MHVGARACQSRAARRVASEAELQVGAYSHLGRGIYTLVATLKHRRLFSSPPIFKKPSVLPATVLTLSTTTPPRRINTEYQH